ncbi:MAG: radical SAM protein [Verrucomicrobia bacterium]|nr:radical SAM protein [Verrucomicrobiota bacterium]
MRIPKTVVEFVLRQALASNSPLVQRFTRGALSQYIDRELATLPAPSKTFMKRLMTHGIRTIQESSPTCRKRAVENFIIKYLFMRHEKAKLFEAEHGFRPPQLIVVSPSMRCNLHCYGCYAGCYTKKDDLPFEVFNRVLDEGKEMGIHFVVISGGEPFFSPDLIPIFERQSDIYFQVYTNGTLIDEAMADELARVGNAVPVISVEGFEEWTDARRGPGTFRKVLDAMRNLRERGVPFGISVTVTRENNEFVVSDEFVRFWCDQGAWLAWYFNYVPIGLEPDMALMPTAEQRKWRRREFERVRAEMPMLMADFWNDGILTGGCMAGGRLYLHINCKGDVEPCVFVHYAVDNIKDKSLVECLQSPLFERIRSKIPYDGDLSRPCMIVDHPSELREHVALTGAVPTHPGADSVTTVLAGALDEYAAEYARICEPVIHPRFRDRYAEATAKAMP